ncbi:unnamed protein product, partial [Nippostrongylus brasiliensis]|uniref:Acyl_transf_3 domain-containing protein n=1 Tax=Nippostrongylus brasiliensis TaxID=27835 RepID=A0A0N4Y8Z6_NIPBR
VNNHLFRRSQNAGSKANIRLDLQGLRGVAILSVLGFHFFPKSFPNGFVGVDQFFVLSGFLMAMILNSGSGSPNICDFYYRRLKRIVPMHGLIILLILWSCILSFPDSNVDLNMESATSAMSFLSNLPPLVDGKFTGYYKQRIQLYMAEDLFAHTWSLAVEMQFYLIVPLLSMFLKRRSVVLHTYSVQKLVKERYTISSKNIRVQHNVRIKRSTYSQTFSLAFYVPGQYRCCSRERTRGGIVQPTNPQFSL